MVLQVFKWTSQFETGVELIDSQHQTLVSLTNELGDAVILDDRVLALRVLEQVVEYAGYHFKAEEAWFAKARVSPQDLAVHHQTHQEFVLQLERFAERWQEDRSKAQALHRFLTAWLISHILGDDRDMVRSLSQRSGSTAEAPVPLSATEQVLLDVSHNLHDALSALTRDLELKVQDRTAELTEANARLKASFLTSIRTFTSLMELRGGMLAGHSRRVAELARQLALCLKLDTDAVEQVYLGALLHDIGKIGLTDDLLGKPVVRMSTHDLALYQTHCANGEGALLAMEELQGASEAVRSHHEHWDGQGFPDGLAGERIPLSARIVSVANDFDNLQQGVSMGRRLSVDEALHVIQDNCGERYDPQVVEALSVTLGRSDFESLPESEVTGEALLPGMMLSRDLVTPDGVLLLAANTALAAQTVARVRRFMEAGGLNEFPVYVRPDGSNKV